MTFNQEKQFKLLSKTKDGDQVLKNNDTIFIKFGPKRNGIVSSWLNGGYNEDLNGVFNHQLTQENIDRLGDGGILEYLIDLSSGYSNYFDFENNRISGLVTSANIDNFAIACEKYRDIEVMAITTAGVRVNAVSAGDVASYYEINDQYDFNIADNDNGDGNPNKLGTINVFLLINCRLDESSLLLAQMIVDEAKGVALRDLMTSSNYSNDIATGTGTDGIAIFSNMDSVNSIENVSKHAKIGELIAKAVIRSIKESLAKVQWLTPSYQLNALVRLDRYKYNLDDFYDNYLKSYVPIETEEDKKNFILSLMKVSKNPELVAYVSVILNLLDQCRWGLLSKKTVLKVSDSILENQFNRDDWHAMKLLVKYVIETQLE